MPTNHLGTSLASGFRATAPPKAADFYSWTDLRIGTSVHVYGRDMLLFDCDDFTRAWYREMVGLPEEALAPIPVR